MVFLSKRGQGRSLSALHLSHSDAPSSARQNLHFDTPSSPYPQKTTHGQTGEIGEKHGKSICRQGISTPSTTAQKAANTLLLHRQIDTF